MNLKLNDKIKDLMKNMARLQDSSAAVPQNLSASLAQKIDSKVKKPKPNSTTESSHQPRSSSKSTKHLTSNHTPRHAARNAVTSSSQLPPTLLQHPNTENSPQTFDRRNANRKRISANIEAQSSNLKLTTEERDALITRILTTELQVRSKVDAQAKELYSSPKSKNGERHTPAPSSQTPPVKSTPKAVSGRTGRTKYEAGMSLTPIPEASEVDTDHHDEERNDEGYSRSYMEKIIAQENLRQRRMESELPSKLIQDIDASFLLQPSSDDSLDELVIKDFAIRVIESEPDAAITSLPIKEQVLIESNKLGAMIESVKERFQVKVARDKFAEREKQKMQAPSTRLPTAKEFIQMYNSVDEGNNKPTTGGRTIPVNNIIDSENWGSIALQKPLLDEPPGDSSSDEDFLNETDMQFNDLFGANNVSEPMSLRTSPRTVPQQQSQRERTLHSVENVEDLESPPQYISDLSSDESVQRLPPENLNISDFEDPQFPPEMFSSDETAINSALTEHNNQLPNGNNSLHETQQEKDVRKLKALIESGALTSSMAKQAFEEGVLDLLLRQSDSLWQQIVAGIPISFFVPSQRHEKGLLDTSINETNLASPLVEKPKRKLPEYMEALENEWTTKTHKNIEAVAVDVNNNDVDKDDEHLLIKGLPEPSFERELQNRYRKRRINIMDREDGLDDSDDSDDILGDDEMIFDDLTNNVAVPTYDFQKAKLMDDLEIKLKILERRKERNDSIISKAMKMGKLVSTQQPNDQAKQTTQDQPVPIDNTVKIRKSVSFAESGPYEPSATSQINNSKKSAHDDDDTDAKKWTTLNISKVKDLLKQARLAQAKHKESTLARKSVEANLRKKITK